jgi:spore maturation protein CgeB
MQKSTGIRVLFTGQYWPGANSMYIAHAFQNNGAVIHIINETNIYPGWTSIPGRTVRRLVHPLIEREWNQQLLEQVTLFRPHLVYITNANLCWPETLQRIKSQGIPIMCFYHDVPWKSHDGLRFQSCLPFFDLVATTRHWHIDEFKSAGAKEVMVVRFGYDPDVHYPISPSQSDEAYYGSDLTFIGTFGEHREKILSEVLKIPDFNYQFKLWGNLWDKLTKSSPILAYWQKRSIFSYEIPIIYATAKIALHWIRVNPNGSDEAMRKGDQHNSRTFQIAACGGAMMLAQRTTEHEHFFKENEEAIFFDNAADLREKLDYWLAPERDTARKAIAQAARQRCIDEDYTYNPVVRRFLEYFNLPVS